MWAGVLERASEVMCEFGFWIRKAQIRVADLILYYRNNSNRKLKMARSKTTVRYAFSLVAQAKNLGAEDAKWDILSSPRSDDVTDRFSRPSTYQFYQFSLSLHCLTISSLSPFSCEILKEKENRNSICPVAAAVWPRNSADFSETFSWLSICKTRVSCSSESSDGWVIQRFEAK